MRRSRNHDNLTPGFQTDLDKTGQTSKKGCVIRIEFNLVVAIDFLFLSDKQWEHLRVFEIGNLAGPLCR